MRLLILGLLMEQNRHPYEIRRTIKARNWHLSFKLRDGSLYYAVDQLHAQQMIEVVETIPVPGDNRPDKTIYRITEQGKAEFQSLLYRQLQETAYPQHPVFVCMPFLQYADTSLITDHFARLADNCLMRKEHLQAVLELKNERLPNGAVKLIQGMIMFSETEHQWLQSVLEDARSGKLTSKKEKPQ